MQQYRQQQRLPAPAVTGEEALTPEAQRAEAAVPAIGPSLPMPEEMPAIPTEEIDAMGAGIMGMVGSEMARAYEMDQPDVAAEVQAALADRPQLPTALAEAAQSAGEAVRDAIADWRTDQPLQEQRVGQLVERMENLLDRMQADDPADVYRRFETAAQELFGEAPQILTTSANLRNVLGRTVRAVAPEYLTFMAETDRANVFQYAVEAAEWQRNRERIWDFYMQDNAQRLDRAQMEFAVMDRIGQIIQEQPSRRMAELDSVISMVRDSVTGWTEAQIAPWQAWQAPQDAQRSFVDLFARTQEAMEWISPVLRASRVAGAVAPILQTYGAVMQAAHDRAVLQPSIQTAISTMRAQNIQTAWEPYASALETAMRMAGMWQQLRQSSMAGADNREQRFIAAQEGLGIYMSQVENRILSLVPSTQQTSVRENLAALREQHLAGLMPTLVSPQTTPQQRQQALLAYLSQALSVVELSDSRIREMFPNLGDFARTPQNLAVLLLTPQGQMPEWSQYDRLVGGWMNDIIQYIGQSDPQGGAMAEQQLRGFVGQFMPMFMGGAQGYHRLLEMMQVSPAMPTMARAG